MHKALTLAAGATAALVCPKQSLMSAMLHTAISMAPHLQCLVRLHLFVQIYAIISATVSKRKEPCSMPRGWRMLPEDLQLMIWDWYCHYSIYHSQTSAE